jgi:hypothetical protein
MDALVYGGEGEQSSPAARTAAISQPLDLNPQPKGQAPQGVAETVESYPVAEPEVVDPAAPTQDAAAMPDLVTMSLYDHFLSKLAIETRNGPLTAEVIQERLEINKSQLADWLKRGLADGQIEKLAKPVRYQPAKAQQQTFQL